MCRAGEQGAGTPEPREAQHIDTTQRRHLHLENPEQKQDQFKGSLFPGSGKQSGFSMQSRTLRS